MSRGTWAVIKNNKNFNVHVYRFGLTLLVISLIVNCIIGLLMFYIYANRAEEDYYATSGITPPVKLSALAAPNNSDSALLAPDPPSGEIPKLIPQ